MMTADFPTKILCALEACGNLKHTAPGVCGQGREYIMRSAKNVIRDYTDRPYMDSYWRVLGSESQFFALIVQAWSMESAMDMFGEFWVWHHVAGSPMCPWKGSTLFHAPASRQQGMVLLSVKLTWLTVLQHFQGGGERATTIPSAKGPPAISYQNRSKPVKSIYCRQKAWQRINDHGNTRENLC